LSAITASSSATTIDTTAVETEKITVTFSELM
jgi:hypothetical protein